MDRFEQATRTVFDRHHREQAGNEHIFGRLVGLISEEYFGVEPGAFATWRILDAGCGSNANASFAFLARGAKSVVSLDLGDAWISCASTRLSRFGDRSELVPGNVLSLPFEAGRFDLVHCAGVLHHTADPARGFRELARVTGPGGRLFVTIMGNANGIIYSCINTLRQKYLSDAQFRATVDGLDVEVLSAGIGWLLSEKDDAEPELLPGENAVFRSFFDQDLILTIKDRLQAPTYHEFAFTETQIREWFADAGFEDVRRLTRYPKGFRNLRRFLAPMYCHYDHPTARLWFGDGYIQMIGRRPADQE
jgi:SAM-dependent methyltransferase